MAEGRPKVVAEALATGLPCVVSEQDVAAMILLKVQEFHLKKLHLTLYLMLL